MSVVVVIPAYEEVACIRDVATRALETCPKVIVVDDGSIDATSAQLEGLDVRVLRHAENRGKADALWTGCSAALAMGATAVVTIDGDGQHDPADIPRLLAVHAKYPDRIVIGSRLHDRANFPTRRYYANRTAGFWISWAAGYPIADTQSGFRVYPASLLRRLRREDFIGRGFTLESEVLIIASRVGVRSIAAPIAGIYPKTARASHFRPVADIALIVVMVAGHLLRRGMNPLGLWRSLGKAELVRPERT